MMILDVDRALAGHVAVALARHRQALRREQIAAPDGFDDLLAAVTRRAKAGHGGTEIDRTADLSHAHLVPASLLLTKAEAAESLGMSTRNLARLIAAGRLTAVRTGPGSIRIRRADLEAYVASLDPVGTAGMTATFPPELCPRSAR